QAGLEHVERAPGVSLAKREVADRPARDGLAEGMPGLGGDGHRLLRVLQSRLELAQLGERASQPVSAADREDQRQAEALEPQVAGERSQRLAEDLHRLPVVAERVVDLAQA